MELWNIDLFLALNAGDAPDAFAVLAATLAAEWFNWIAVSIMVALWVWGTPAKRGALLTAAVTLLFGLAINFSIGLVFYHPRPFELEIGRTLLSHELDSSFPSNHATFIWSLGFGLIAAGGWRLWGWLFCALGLATAWGRVYLGVHFPFDMLGSLEVAIIGAVCIGTLRRHIERLALPIVDSSYEAVLRALRLPVAVFPRRSASN